MTKEEQRRLDAIYAAETHEEQVQAFIEAFDLIDEERQPLILMLLQEKDSRNDDQIIREFFRKADTDKLS